MKAILKGIGLLALLLAGAPLRPVQGQTYYGPPTDANGAAPRPFYIIGHNPNTRADCVTCLDAGCNALEPDVSWGHLYPNLAGPQTLRVYHDCTETLRDTSSIEEFCVILHDLAIQYPQLALIVFDYKGCSSATGYTQDANQLMDAIHNYLNTNGVNLNIIINYGTEGLDEFFNAVFPRLGPKEGVNIDFVNSVDSAKDYWRSLGYTGNIGWADGINIASPFPSGHVYHDYGVYQRAARGVIKSDTYSWVFNSSSEMSEYINSGVDGIIPESLHDDVITCVNQVSAHQEVRLATRADNIWQPQNEAYALEVITSSGDFLPDEGTDANLTFTLNGANGSSKITVNTGYVGRMEYGDGNYVTIPSRDLGALTSIRVDNDGGGKRPGLESLPNKCAECALARAVIVLPILQRYAERLGRWR